MAWRGVGEGVRRYFDGRVSQTRKLCCLFVFVVYCLLLFFSFFVLLCLRLVGPVLRQQAVKKSAWAPLDQREDGSCVGTVGFRGMQLWRGIVLASYCSLFVAISIY